MKILSIDTSSIVCSVSILENKNIIYEKSVEKGLSHSEILMPMIESAFNESKLSLKDIDLYTCSIGPGSFTGIRIGISTIKAFIDVYNKPSIGISSLEGLAYNIPNSQFICSIIDAKNNNVYAQIYELKDNIYIQLENYLSDTIDITLSNLNNYFNTEITFVGDGSISYRDLIIKYFKKSHFANELENKCNSVSIGIAAYNKFNNKELINSTISPLYLKKSQAERLLEEGKLK